jgi:hypothetical protein
VFTSISLRTSSKALVRGQWLDTYVTVMPFSRKFQTDDIIRFIREGENKKILCQLLSQAPPAGGCGREQDQDVETADLCNVQSVSKWWTLSEGACLLTNVGSVGPPREAVAKNALAKFDATISNKYSAQLEGFSEEDYRKLEYLNDLFEFLDDIIPEEEPEPEVPQLVAKGRRGR